MASLPGNSFCLAKLCAGTLKWHWPPHANAPVDSSSQIYSKCKSLVGLSQQPLSSTVPSASKRLPLMGSLYKIPGSVNKTAAFWFKLSNLDPTQEPQGSPLMELAKAYTPGPHCLHSGFPRGPLWRVLVTSFRYCE